MNPDRDFLGLLPRLPRDADGPVFAEPWQAKAFAMTLTLHEKGLFSWEEWADALSDEIKTAQVGGDPDLGNTYYEHWLRALERLVTAKGVTNQMTLEQHKERWRQAYLSTPHGQPVDLSSLDD